MTEKTAAHLWFYLNEGMFSSKEEGPFTEPQLLELAKSQKIRLDTILRSPTRTGNKPVRAESIAKLAVAINQATIDFDKKKADEKEAAKQLKAVQKQEQEKRKTELAVAKVESIKSQKKSDVESLPRPVARPVPDPPHMPQMQPLVQNIQFHAPPSNTVPCLLSGLLWPGLGQLVQGRLLAGMIFGILWPISIVACIALIGFVTTPILWLASIADCYRFKGR